MVNRRLIGLILFASLAEAQSFQDFQRQQQQQYHREKQAFIDFKEQEDKAFKEHLEKEAKAIAAYKKKVRSLWPSADLENPKKIVNFSKDLQTQEVIDFEKNEIHITRRKAQGEYDKRRLLAQLNHTLHLNNKEAYKENQLEQDLREKNPPNKYIKTAKVDDTPLLFPEKVDLNALKINQKGETMTLTYTLPKNSTYKRSSTYLVSAKSNAQRFKLKANWLLAIMHSESSFNPMARSHVPAYGLMQIVPRTAGIDAYQFVYKKRRLLSASYLFNTTNNIEMGAAYFHILYYKYLASIKDPTSRLYCCIAAYNTGAGNVARSFTGKNNVKKAAQRINTMSAQAVYDYLIRHLPYDETKHYLKRVNERQITYQEVYKL